MRAQRLAEFLERCFHRKYEYIEPDDTGVGEVTINDRWYIEVTDTSYRLAQRMKYAPIRFYQSHFYMDKIVQEMRKEGLS